MLDIDIIVYGDESKSATKSTLRQFERLNVSYFFVALDASKQAEIEHLRQLNIGYHDQAGVTIEVTGNIQPSELLPQKAWTGFHPSKNRRLAQLMAVTCS